MTYGELSPQQEGNVVSERLRLYLQCDSCWLNMFGLRLKSRFKATVSLLNDWLNCTCVLSVILLLKHGSVIWTFTTET